MYFARSSASRSGAIAEADAVYPHLVRRLVRAGLERWDQPDLAESAELLVTELVTNALKHGRGTDIGVRLYLTTSHLVMEVRDGSSERPVLRTAAPEDEDGRGLFLVDAIADAWGVTPDGTSTWCSLPSPAGSAQTEPATTTAPPPAPHSQPGTR
ncbi:ATP-binding protein [Streptomyces mirabilis]|uniref:ATP-binding protein n=1 Tax=Streptomyces mirabilis TaxID=68239 RepID=UPI0033AD0412